MTDSLEKIVETGLIVNGEWGPSLSGRKYEVRNPANPEEVVGRAVRANADDVNLAVEAAHKAFPEWSSLSYHERAEYLRRVDKELVADKEDLQFRTRLFTREHGKILKESGMEMSRLGDRFLLCAGYAERLSQDEELQGPPFDTIITRQARGVALLIVPWNWPLSILGAKLPQALITGNTVVIKTAYESPLAPALTIKKMVEVLPPGVINLVTGPSSEIGDALLTHPLARKINFTGGIESGRHIMAMAAKTLKPVTLELGGNDPAIILEDADLSQESLQRMAMGTFLTAGQVCMALKRIYVHTSRNKELVEGFTGIVSKHLVGNGLNPDVTMGPLNNEDQLRFVQGLVADARQKGATVNEVGQIEDKELFKRGYFHRPTIITDVDPETEVVKKEQFGPVVPIIPFERIEDAIRMANDTEYGLCSSVWTTDKERALQIARQLEAGYTYLNAHGPMAQDSRAPFGGFKESGIGRALGFEGVLEFLEYHSISSAPGWLF